ncbi:hypothetical protein [Filimonas effusa]|uniref:DUF4221 domain-containing protein n=1 Tax=Filimonas effusa TaxID=2508721 RepID=A0A4Q1CYU0_9BACT|nr:hypothetical protein [Filimonas effusa]RXK80484.1 hypothetical protein ESB13_23585 [Filimonas effusa]
MMKIFVFFAVFFLAIKDGCKAMVDGGMEDTVKTVVDVNVADNLFTKGLNDILLSDLYKDTLYLINKGKLVVIDTKSRSVATDVKVNLFLGKQLKLNKYARAIAAYDNGYYISFLNEIYTVSKGGEVSKIYTGYYFVDNIKVLDSNRSLIASRDSVKMITLKGEVLSFLPFEFTGTGYVQASKVISYSAVPEDSVYEFGLSKGSSISLKRFAPVALTKVMNEPIISCSTDDYFVAFDYSKRNTIYVLKKDMKKNEVVRTIKLKGFNYDPTLAEIQKEEGNPNFKIAFNNGIFYVIALVKGRLRVLSFVL